MSRKGTKTIDQVEETFSFKTTDAKEVDKRKEPKEFEIYRTSVGLYRIRYTAGGEVPDALKGSFTSISRAQAVVNNVLAEREQRRIGAEASSPAS